MPSRVTSPRPLLPPSWLSVGRGFSTHLMEGCWGPEELGSLLGSPAPKVGGCRGLAEPQVRRRPSEPRTGAQGGRCGDLLRFPGRGGAPLGGEGGPAPTGARSRRRGDGRPSRWVLTGAAGELPVFEKNDKAGPEWGPEPAPQGLIFSFDI